MARYLQVSSNDTLIHRALDGSPETLCGKIVADVLHSGQVPELNNTTGGPRECDICESLGGDSLLKNTFARSVEAGRACSRCQDGFDSSGNLCLNCGGSGWLDEGEDYEDYYSDLTGIDPTDLRGTRVAAGMRCDKCGNLSGGITVGVGNEDWCTSCASDSKNSLAQPVDLNQTADHGAYGDEERHVAKTATNWTRDGVPIVDGFTVMIDKQVAQRTPFLDYSRVAVSEQRDCAGCEKTEWVSRIASCDTCGELKCRSCMETIGASTFFGMCKTCASTDSDEAYEAEYEITHPEQGRYLAFLLKEDDDNTDPLFLPNDLPFE